MKKISAFVAAAVLAGSFAAAAPASAADLCLQFSGMSCALSGDPGFFRFTGAKFPGNNKKAIKLNGRACGTGSVTGTLVMTSDSTSTHLSASFVCDATFGAITADFNPAQTELNNTSTNAYASYGSVNLAGACTATIVDCINEP